MVWGLLAFCGVWGRFLSLVRVISTGHSAPMGLKHRSRLYPGLTPGATYVPPLWGSLLGRFLWLRIRPRSGLG